MLKVFLSNLFYSVKHKDRSDRILSLSVVGYFAIIAGNSSIKTALHLEGTSLYLALSLFSYGLLAFIIIKGLIPVLKRRPNLLKSSLICFGTLIFFSVVWNIVENRPVDIIFSYLLLWNIFIWIPIGCCACSVRDKSTLYEYCVNYSYVISAFLLLTYFINSGTTNDSGAINYNMSFGFSMMFPLLIHVTEYRRRKNMFVLILALLELVAMIQYGNRGALLSVIFYFFALFFISKQFKSYRIPLLIVVSVIVVAIIALGEQLLFSLLLYMDAHDMTVGRTLSMLSGGDITSGSGRDLLRTISLDMIREKPLIGWGMGGEYYEITRRYGGSIEEVSSAFNPHNGILENLIWFGVIGGVIASLFCLLPYRFLKQNINKDVFEILLIFGSMVVPNFISATGFFVKPEVAVFLYVYYFSKKSYA